MLAGQAKLRTHLPADAALNSVLVFDAASEEWLVKVKIWPDAGGVIELGLEPLEEFPSELMIAQAMLVA